MTLSQTAVITKQIITLSIIFLILGLLSFIGYKVWYAYYLAHLPIKEPTPDTRFGILPALDFPKMEVSSSNFTYSIDTTTGNLPKLGIDEGFDKIINVYFITKTYATLLSSQKSEELANKFGIQSKPQILSDINYLYRDGSKSININLDTGNFIYVNEASVSARETLDSDNKLVNDFQTLLTTLGVYKNEFKKGQTKIVLLLKNGNQFIPTTVRTEAEAVQISLWPEPIDKKPILTSDFNRSLVSAVVVKTTSDLNRYLTLNFTFWPVDITTFATYPIKPPDQAFDDLKSGKGVIVLIPPKPQVSISSVYLAYFLPDNYSSYLQPIYVFEGPNFVAYVSAINSQFQNPAN